MLKPKQMSRLLIAASRDQMGPVIAELIATTCSTSRSMWKQERLRAMRVSRSVRLFQVQAKRQVTC